MYVDTSDKAETNNILVVVKNNHFSLPVQQDILITNKNFASTYEIMCFIRQQTTINTRISYLSRFYQAVGSVYLG
jgi:hypothetical protein